MTSFSFRASNLMLRFLATRVLLVSLMMLAGCSDHSDLMGNRAIAQKQTQAKSTSVSRPPNASNVASSRLDSQPWPPTMGQTYTPNPYAQPPSAQTQQTLAPPSYTTPTSMTGGKIQVAILLPLSGKSATLGQAMLNAAQLAVFDMGGTNFELMPRDTLGTPDGAAHAARDAMASGARLLIGPLFAADVAAVKPIVQTSNVNMLALSTDTTLAESGAYIMGFAPAPQVERIISYAAAHGAKHFAALIPATPYGALVRNAFEHAVQRHGGTVVDEENYNPGVHDSLPHVQALAAKRTQIDALFLPEDANEVRLIATQLAANGFDSHQTHILGTGLWDEPNLAKGAEFLIGGWYPAAEPDARGTFTENYKQAYNQDPPRLATLAYDATALAAVIAKRGGSFDRVALSNPSGFAGLDGIFRLTPNGTVQRGLAILEVTTDAPRTVDPAPSTFAGTMVGE